MQTQIDVYWHDRRIGHKRASRQIWAIGMIVEVRAINLPDIHLIEIAEMDIVFDPDFAELRGITGVPLEPRKDNSDA